MTSMIVKEEINFEGREQNHIPEKVEEKIVDVMIGLIGEKISFLLSLAIEFLFSNTNNI